MSDVIDTLVPPTDHELHTLRALHARTRAAHAQAVVLPVGAKTRVSP